MWRRCVQQGPKTLWKTSINTPSKDVRLGEYLPPHLLSNFKFSAPDAIEDYGSTVRATLPAISEQHASPEASKINVRISERHILLVDRVVRVTKGGKQSSFRVVVVVGNRMGLVGMGIGKAKNARDAIPKAVEDAKHNLVRVNRCEGRTLFHDATVKFKATILELRTAPSGYGLRCDLSLIHISEPTRLR